MNLELFFQSGKDDIEWYQSCEVDYPSNEEAVRHDLTNSQINKVDFGNGLVFSCLLPNEIVSLISDESGNILNKYDVFKMLESHIK